MKSVLFYTQNRWAFGQIHHALIKRLWEHGIYAHLLDWTQHYSDTEFELLNEKFETFMTTPEAVGSLVHRGIPISKIICVAHHEKDIVAAVKDVGAEFVSGVKRFGVMTPDLVGVARQNGIVRPINEVRYGLDFDHYFAPIANELKTVGYAGEIASHMSDGSDFKRSHLIPMVIARVPLALRQHEFYNHLCMAGYYTKIDALLVSSSYETAGLPAMEAATAGRLVVGTPVGYFDGSSGILCRLDADGFVADAARALEEHMDPRKYREQCERAQQYARDHYDWRHVIDKWLELLA